MSSLINENNIPLVSCESTNMLQGNVHSRRSESKPVSLLKLFFDGLSFSLILLSWLILQEYGKPIRQPFLCADLSLYYPPPTNNMFPKQRLFIVTIIMPIIVIFLSEAARWCHSYRKGTARAVYELQIRSTTYNIPAWIGNLYIIIWVFLFSHSVNTLLTNIGKVMVGRFRPHFILSCFKKYAPHDFCTDATQWIVNYKCLGESSTAVEEKYGAYNIRKSFPSSHASTAFCGLIFLALYIHRTWNHRNVGLLPYVLETGCFGLAAYIGIIQITENRHHPTDVLAGSILGIVTAIIAFRCMVPSLKQVVPVDLDSGITKGKSHLDTMP